jgi:hypothetical protein
MAHGDSASRVISERITSGFHTIHFQNLKSQSRSLHASFTLKLAQHKGRFKNGNNVGVRSTCLGGPTVATLCNEKYFLFAIAISSEFPLSLRLRYTTRSGIAHVV